MTTFPVSPTDGDETSDGKFVWADPPGVWRLITGTLDADLVALAAADNSPVLIQVNTPFTLDKEQQFNNITGLDEETQLEVSDAVARNRRERHQTISQAVTGPTQIDLSRGRFVHVPESAGAWSPDFLNVPIEGVEIWLTYNPSDANHAISVALSVWGKATPTPPIASDYQAGDQFVFRIVKLPFVERWIIDWIDEGAAPPLEPDPITPPTVTAVWSANANGSSPTDLTAATLPEGEVAIFVGPDSSDVESYRLFVNLVGSVPAIGSEGDAFIGTRSASPYSLLGSTGGLAIMWDTNVDPTGNNRADYDPNGSTTLTVAPKLIDGTEPTATTFTFDTSNAPPSGGTPTSTYSSQFYGSALTDHTVTVPDGVDRVVMVMAAYGGTDASITGLTIGGTAMTNVAAATGQNGGSSTGQAVYTAYALEASLTTGNMTISPTWSATPPSFGRISYHVAVYTNLASPTFAGDIDAADVAITTTTALTTSIASVPANSKLFAVMQQANLTGAAITCDLGTLSTTIENDRFESAHMYLEDTGALGTETANWTGEGRGHAAMVYLDYEASGGGTGEEPIVPGTPTVALTTPIDNQIVATWASTTDAVSYEMRHGTSNPPATSIITGVLSPRTISGLAAGVVRYVQVRAVSSDGTRSAWSTVQSATPTGDIDPPLDFSGKMLTATTPYDGADYIEGRASYDYPAVSGLSTGIKVTNAIHRRNPSSTEFAMRNLAQDSWLDRAITLWERERGSSAFVEQMGPRLPVSMKLGPLNLGNNNSVSSASASASMIADMGRTGSKGTVNRLDTLQALTDQLNRQYRGFNVWEIVCLSLAHETNGPWSFSGYMGKNPNVIGQPVLTSATNSQYGVDMATALRKAGATGECADVHRLAVERVMEVLWDPVTGNPNIIVGMTPSDGGDSIPPDQPVSSNGNTWIYDAFPRASEGFQLDFLAPTIYARMPGDMVYSGSGSRDLYTNWSRKTGFLEYADEYVAEHACAFGFLEVGVSYAVPGGPVAGRTLLANDVEAPSDEANVAFYERLFNHELTTMRFPQGFVFVNHWAVTRGSGKPPGVKIDTAGRIQGESGFVSSGSLGGGSYVLNEGMWGEYPAGADVTSLAKPTWSGVGTPGYSKTLDWFEGNFPR